MENSIKVPITMDETPASSNNEGVLLIPVSDIKEELVQIKTEDITDEEFLECIGVTCDNIKDEPGYEEEYLESDCSESNLVINEDITATKIHNKDNQDEALALADFIESNKLVVDYDAHITREPETHLDNMVVQFTARKRRFIDLDLSHRYKCGVCFVRFSEKRKVRQHMALHDENIECYCNCNGFSIPMSSAEVHIHRHTQQNVISKSPKCEECGKSFLTKANLDEHIAQKSHRCSVCTTLTFASCIAMKHHQVIHHSDSFSCIKCGKLFRFIEHYRKHCVECKYCACEICDKLFQTGEILKKHVEMQHLNVDDVFNCPLCGQSLDRSDYNTHHCTMGFVARGGPVKLPLDVQQENTIDLWSVPPKSLSIDTPIAPETSETDLLIVTKMPKRSRKRCSREVKGSYTCEYCGRIYPWMSSLRRHVSDVHVNTKMYWCSRCSKVFRLKCSLDIHKCIVSKKMQKGTPLSCPACPSLHTASDLSKHIIQFHPEIVNNDEDVEHLEDTIEELTVEENQPVETVVNTEMRAAELFHMFTEDFEDDLILLNSSDQIEIKEEAESPEPVSYESIDDYLQSTDRINRIQIAIDKSTVDSDLEIIENKEVIQVIKEEPLEVKESAQEDELLMELNESSELSSDKEEKPSDELFEKNAIYSCVPCKFSENSFAKYVEHWASHCVDLSECPQCQKKIQARSELLSHINSHIRRIYRKCRRYKVKSCKNIRDQSNKYSCKICAVYVLKERRYRHWESHFIVRRKISRVIEEVSSSKVTKRHYSIEENSEKENLRKEIVASNIKKPKYVTKVDSEDGKQKYIYNKRNPCSKSVLSHLKKLKLLEKLAATESAMDPVLDIKVEILSDDELCEFDKSSVSVPVNKLEKICALCNKSFGRMQCLKRHLIEHIVNSIMHKKDPNDEFRCRLCDDISFSKVQIFKRHLRQHADLPMYDCNLCNKTFADSSNYAKHKKVHGLLYMQCDLCKRKFNTKRMLIGHMQYHEENEPQPCPLCNKLFHFSSGLKKHLRTQHTKTTTQKSQLYPCKHCMLRFGSLKEKWIHQWNEHGVRKCKNDCLICKRGYRTRSDLRRHLRHVHNIAIKTYELTKIIDACKTGTSNNIKSLLAFKK